MRKSLLFVVLIVGLFIMPVNVPQVEASSAWYNTNWQYRKSVTISGNAGAGTDYSVMVEVPYNAAMQATFSDIVFTDNDGTTALSYWRETYTASTTATFWVKVTDNLDSGGSIFMYYGNTGASYTGAGEDVFLFFDDFEGTPILPGDFSGDWDETGADWSVQSSVKKYGSYAAYCDSGAGGGGVERNLFYNQNFSTPIMVHTWFRVTSTFSSYRYGIHALADNNIAGVIGYSNDWIWWNGGSQTWELNTLAANTWYRCELAFDYTNDLMRFWKNRVSVGSHDMKDYTDTSFTWHNQTGCLSNGGANANYDQYQDDFYIRKYVYGDCSFSAFGAEQEYIGEWNDLTGVSLIFSMVTTSMRGWLFLLGAGLAISSGLFLVYWFKRDKKDKLTAVYFAVVVFVVGWALMLGG